MKLTAFILLIGCLHVSARSASQTVTLSGKNIPLEKVFAEIKRQTGFRVFYNYDLLRATQPVTIEAHQMPLQQMLREILKNQSLSYAIENKNIVITVSVSALPPLSRVTGRVLSEDGKPLAGVTVGIKGAKNAAAITDDDGYFKVQVSAGAVLVFSYVSYETAEYKITPAIIASSDQPTSSNGTALTITLHLENNKLSEVVVSTGYQMISKERATGSFTLVDNKTLNRAVSPDLLSRLNGVTNGLLLDAHTGNPAGISVRGRSTIFSNTEPLIVVDNFPFEGDINTLNPNDVENVTVLKDAAAASIWGVRAGNGVIVITTKHGKFNQKPTVTLTANLTIGDKPDLYYQPQLTSGQFIDLEKYLFTQGAYDATLSDGYSVVSPVVSILQQQQLNELTAAEANQLIDALRNIDVRDQESQYFYRRSTRQQYHVDINGGGTNQTYYFSAGFDKNLPNDVSSSDSRFTLKANNTYNLFNDKLKLSTDITFSNSKTSNYNGQGYIPYLPYEQIADRNGNSLATLQLGGLRAAYTDTAGNGKLLDWKYRPLDELTNRYSKVNSNSTDYRLNIGAVYKLLKPLTISVNYEYYNADMKGDILQDGQSFYVRNLVNTFSQINSATATVTRPIPVGSIYSPSFATNQANYGRGQLNFNQSTGGKGELTAIAGYEVREDSYKSNSITLYGYDPATATNTQIDYLTQFPYYYGYNISRIGSNSFQSGTLDRYISYYGNASYIYDGRYIISGSYRKDESNLFGVKANQKGVPLWSAGTAWNLYKEKFFDVPWISLLQLKATYGYNGNVDKSVSAYLTGAPALFTNTFRSNFINIVNPPNAGLRWEKVKNINLGVDFSTTGNRLSGSLEYYIKDGIDLIGTSPVAPQTGITSFTGNSADTHTAGFDIQMNSKNLDGEFKWNTTLIFNSTKDKITGYEAKIGANGNIVSSYTSSLSPLKGYPINSVFGLRWKGLDANGNPQGELNGSASEDYTGIIGSNDPGQLDFFGSAVPAVFGSIRNTFTYRNLELSCNIIYKFNYYFRRPSINYTNLFGGNYAQPDYNKRWQKPGDELKTSVPSVMYPDDFNRDQFYQFSSALVEKGDHIRLQDIQLNYNFSKDQFKHLPFASLNIYVYANNIGLLWKANHEGLDPNVVYGYPPPRTIAFGIKTTF